MIIVVNCPGCQRRYELDGALAGKKSRCKQCGEIFKIPVPTAREVGPAPSPPVRPAAPAAPPAWTAAPLADLLDGDPVAAAPGRPAARPPSRPSYQGAASGTTGPPPIARAKPAPPPAFDDDLPPPPRAGTGPSAGAAPTNAATTIRTSG